MFEREITLNKFMIAYVLRMIRDIPEAQWYHTTPHHINSPGWCIGHLATECDHALMHIGKERVCPGTWDIYFLQGTQPEESNDKLPKKSTITDALQLSYKRFRQGIQKLTVEEISQPSPSQFLAKFLPTYGEWISHMLTTHIAMHAGSIGTWRRVAGLVSISQLTEKGSIISEG